MTLIPYASVLVLLALGGLLLLSRKDSRQAGKDEENLNELKAENKAMQSDKNFADKLTAGDVIKLRDRLNNRP